MDEAYIDDNEGDDTDDANHDNNDDADEEEDDVNLNNYLAIPI